MVRWSAGLVSQCPAGPAVRWSGGPVVRSQCFLKECIRRAEYALLHKSGHSVYAKCEIAIKYIKECIRRRVYSAKKECIRRKLECVRRKLECIRRRTRSFFCCGRVGVFGGRSATAMVRFALEKLEILRTSQFVATMSPARGHAFL